MKKIVMAICLSFIASVSFAGKIDSFKDLEKRLRKGDDVKALYKLLGLRYEAPKHKRQRRARIAKSTCLLPYPELGSE